MTEATLLLYTETTNSVLARFKAQIFSYAVTGHYSSSLRLPLVPEFQARLHAIISAEEAAHISHEHPPCQLLPESQEEWVHHHSTVGLEPLGRGFLAVLHPESSKRVNARGVIFG